jgi:thiaminase/transcriptional activator TenA
MSRDLVQACRNHPFVRGLGDGSLPQASFSRYVAQDAFYLGAFARSYALAAARCRNLEDFAIFHELMGGAMSEIETHRKYAAELDIPLEGVRPYPETLAYTRFLLGLAWTAGVAEILAAMTPCMSLYAHLGSELSRGGVPEHRYRRWIETYSSEEFATLRDRVEALLDRHATDTASVREAYIYAMTCERDFFSAALREDPGEAPGQEPV